VARAKTTQGTPFSYNCQVELSNPAFLVLR
jgi:hypothetical protein